MEVQAMFKSILCAVDGSDHANKALALAIDLASKYGARLSLLHVLLRNVDARELKRFAEIEGLAKTVTPEIKRMRSVDSRTEILRLGDLQTISAGVLASIAEHIAGAAKDEAKSAGVDDVAVAVLDGDPAKRILEYAEREGVDCIVMGTRGLSDVKSLFLGSVSQKVSNQARCTCIAVK
jgi:nucleotide-binding universal stress UspA family protein